MNDEQIADMLWALRAIAEQLERIADLAEGAQRDHDGAQ